MCTIGSIVGQNKFKKLGINVTKTEEKSGIKLWRENYFLHFRVKMAIESVILVLGQE